MEPRNLIIFTTIVFAILTSLLEPTASQEVENEMEFSYEEGNKEGPEHWSSIHEDWAACNNGHMQSPVDLSDEKLAVRGSLGKLRRSYRPSAATMVNRGHDIMLKWEEGAGGIWLNGTEYILNQLHWHSPSEHSINGRRFALELHLVHESADKKIAVVGILYKIGRSDQFLAEFEEYITALKNIEHGEKEVGIVNPRHIRRGSRKYYRYIGSLTTPPCTEGVVWTIVKKVRTVSKEQLTLLREAVNDESEMNARPIQPINYRQVQFYRPKL